MAANVGTPTTFPQLNDLLKTVADWIKPEVITRGIGNGLSVIASSLEKGDLGNAQQLQAIINLQFNTLNASREQVAFLQNTALMIGPNPPLEDGSIQTTTLYNATEKALVLVDAVIKRYIQENPGANTPDATAMKV